ncbi:unnamed protein product, partial [Heterosigma akashiwo]
MNTSMWAHPLTAHQLRGLEALGCAVAEPVAKTLACGDTGKGAMAAPADVARLVHGKVEAYLAQQAHAHAD